jgi:hypothetical protein
MSLLKLPLGSAVSPPIGRIPGDPGVLIRVNEFESARRKIAVAGGQTRLILYAL